MGNAQARRMGDHRCGSGFGVEDLSNFSIIHDATMQLRRSIFDALQNTADTDFGLGGDIDRITLSSPASKLDDNVVASLYLYRFGINPALRNQPALPDRNDATLFHSPPLPLKLHFLFTPMLDEESTNLLLLGRVLQHMHDEPVITTLNGEPIDDSHGGADMMLRRTPEELEPEALSGLWSAFNSSLRLAAFFKLETIAIASGLPPRRQPRAQLVTPVVGLMERQP